MNKKGKFISVESIRSFETLDNGQKVTKWAVKYLCEFNYPHKDGSIGKQQILAGSRRSLSVTDMRYWKQAENLLLGEIAFVLDIPYAEAVKTVRQRLDEASQATPAP